LVEEIVSRHWNPESPAESGFAPALAYKESAVAKSHLVPPSAAVNAVNGV
jgi:hypothetical protein